MNIQDEIIRACQDSLSSFIHNTEVANIIIDNNGILKAEIEYKDVYKMSNNEIIQHYIDKYRFLHIQKTNEEPQAIIFRSCWINSPQDLNNISIPIIFEGSRVDITQNFVEKVNIIRISNSSINSKEGVHDIRASNVNNCYIKSHLRFNHYGGFKELESSPFIKDSIFLEPLEIYNLYQIENCDINELLVHTGVSIKHSRIKQLAVDNFTNSLNINDTEITKSSFRNANFNGSALFNNVIFIEAPELIKTEFSSRNVNFRNVTFLDKNSGKAIAAYRHLTKLCQDAGYEHGAIQFHALELETYYNYHFKQQRVFSLEYWRDLPERIGSEFHRFFTNYGTNLILPFIWLFSLAIYFFFWYYCVFNKDLHFSLKITFRNFLGPAVLAWPKEIELPINGLILIPDIIQLVLSSIIWFLIIFMIRRRFKL